MSSSESTSDTELTSPTTTLQADTTDALNSNNEFLPSASTSEQFSSDIFSGASKLTFEYFPDDSFGSSFLLRDSLGHLQAKGEVDVDSNIKLRNVNGSELLNIIKRKKESGTELDVQAFDISHQSSIIGTVKVKNDGSLKIRHSGHSQISVLYLKFGHFTIYRSTLMSSPICNIQMPYGEVKSSENGMGTITFHMETGITAEEKLLCTAAAIVFKQQTSHGDITDKVCGCCLAICAVIFAIIVLCALVIAITKRPMWVN